MAMGNEKWMIVPILQRRKTEAKATKQGHGKGMPRTGGSPGLQLFGQLPAKQQKI